MILADINKDKLIEFKVSNIKSIKNVQLIIEFPNDVVKRFDGSIIKNQNEVHVLVPSMKDIITEPSEYPCYLEIEDIYGAFHKLSQDIIMFKFVQVIDVVFRDPDRFNTVNKKEAFLDNIVVNTPTVNSKKAPKKLSRR